MFSTFSDLTHDINFFILGIKKKGLGGYGGGAFEQASVSPKDCRSKSSMIAINNSRTDNSSTENPGTDNSGNDVETAV